MLVFILWSFAACSQPLHTAILGKWDQWCATDDPSDRECLGQDPIRLRKEFRPDGTVALSVVGREQELPEIGTWTLTGDQLEVRFSLGGPPGTDSYLVEQYRARIEGDRLILWKEDQGFGSILQRVGAPVPEAAGRVSDGSPVVSELGGLRYSLDLPPGYRMVRDDNDRQSWAVIDGFRVDLVVSPRPTDGDGVPVPCDGSSGGISGSGDQIGGVDRETSVGRSLCVDPGGRSFGCSVSHSRGWLEPTERDAAISLCSGLVVQ